MSMLATATGYLQSGICVLPARVDEKYTTLSSWKEYQSRLPHEPELKRWFAHGTAMCIVAGSVSGNLEVIDFDLKAEFFKRWCELVDGQAPGLLERLVVERSQSGGKHVIYRCVAPIPGSQKLAQRQVISDSAEPINVNGKLFTPVENKKTGKYEATITFIETRGKGGLFLCAPSPGYVLESGVIEDLPLLTEFEREILIEAALALNEVIPPAVNGPVRQPERSRPADSQHDRPGDDYNERGDFREVLRSHRWVYVGGSDTELWRRPDKTIGHSATIRVFEGKPVLYVFSSNAAPFESEKSYSPYAVYTLLEHSGDYAAAAKALGSQGYGKPTRPSTHQSTALTDDYFDSLQSSTGDQYDRSEPDGDLVEAEVKRAPNLTIRTAGALVREFTTLRPPIIEGLLRRGETMNIIAPSKFGKSWLVLDLAIAVATGRKWLDRYPTIPGKVLLIDNELHPETTASRMPRVAMARGVQPEEYENNISVINLRGGLMNLNQLAIELMLLEPGAFDLILLDAWYRFQPPGSDENSNGDVAKQYDTLDWVAHQLGCAFGGVHHSSKGNQAGKSITDIGSGAGAQSRAADTHMTMIAHEVDGAVVVQSVVRSWAPPDPLCLMWDFPVWLPADHLSPKDVKTVKPARFKTSGLNDKPDPQDTQRAKEQDHRERILAAYRLFPDGETARTVREAAGLSGTKFGPINLDLIGSGAVEKCSVLKGGKPYDGFRLTEVGQVGQVGQIPLSPGSPSQLRCGGTAPPPLGGACPSPTQPVPDSIPTLEGLPDFNDTNGDYR